MADQSEIEDVETIDRLVFPAASHCPSCTTLGEFDLPAQTGQFQIACFECDHIYEIDAHDAIKAAETADVMAQDDVALSDFDSADDKQSDNDSLQPLSISCLDCGGAIEIANDIDGDDDIKCPHCTKADADLPARFSAPALNDYKAVRVRKTGIILVSILSAGLVLAAGIFSLGLYFLTLRTDSDITRYLETTILQLAPAEFRVEQAAYEVSETEVGTSLLVTISVSNQGDVEGAPSEMKVVLTDADNNQLVSWPLDTAGQIIAPGQTTQLYTRLFEPPANFTNLQVFVR